MPRLSVFLAAASALTANVVLAEEETRELIRVQDGNLATDGEFPWHVAIRAREVDSAEDFCGGTITSRRTVVTTASCCSKLKARYSVRDLYVLGGTVDLTGLFDDRNAEVAYVERMFLHKYWEGGNEHNVCAVRLEPPGMDLDSAYVRPLFLPSPLEELEEGEACQVAGWGRSDLTLPLGFSRYLRESTVTVEDEEECDEDHYVGSRMICAKGHPGPCGGGDEGGALVCSGNMFGVILRNRCYEDDYEGTAVYLDAMEYAQFILSGGERYDRAEDYDDDAYDQDGNAGMLASKAAIAALFAGTSLFRQWQFE